MQVVALTDFGSTMTKVALVEQTGRLVGRGESPTTLEVGFIDGYRAAASEARVDAGRNVHLVAELASSSAGGGLRMAAVGLVAELTAAAARQAALNAGARVELLLHGELSDEAVREGFEMTRPDIILFAGGTDFGQSTLVIKNAEVVARHVKGLRVVVACNEDVALRVAALLEPTAASVKVVANVLPKIGMTRVSEAQAAIRQIFVQHVIAGRLTDRPDDFTRVIRMPTPEAVLIATRLLRDGSPSCPALGSLATVDVGGATTDIHSAVSSRSLKRDMVPFAAVRTVEGDLGIRRSARGPLEADRDWLQTRLSGCDAQMNLDEAVSLREHYPDFLPATQVDREIDLALTGSCVALALWRHCSSERQSGSDGLRRDLRNLRVLVGTGGQIAHAGGRRPLDEAINRRSRYQLPTHARVLVDERYVVWASGLLTLLDRDAAGRLLETELLGSGAYDASASGDG